MSWGAIHFSWIPMSLFCYLLKTSDCHIASRSISLHIISSPVHFFFCTSLCCKVERVCRDSIVYDPQEVKQFLIEAKLPDPRPLIHVCDRFDFVDEMTVYLHANSMLKYIEVYVQKVRREDSAVRVFQSPPLAFLNIKGAIQSNTALSFSSITSFWILVVHRHPHQNNITFLPLNFNTLHFTLSSNLLLSHLICYYLTYYCPIWPILCWIDLIWSF